MADPDSEPDVDLAPSLGVYAAASGLASAVPILGLDRALGALARGAAIRRVSARRGVRLTREARSILSHAPPRANGSARLLGKVLARATAPLRIASRLDDALSTWAIAVLLDHHLASDARPAHAPIGADEARRIQRAASSAEVEGALAVLRATPGSIARTLGDAVRSVGTADQEDRTPAERFADVLLDAVARSPAGARAQLIDAFDAAKARGEDGGA